MNLTRRDFGKYAGLGIMTLTAGALSITMDGCNVFQDIENWIPVGEAAFQGIVNLLEGAGLITPAINPLVTTIIAAFNDLLADIKAYQAITPPPAGLLAKIEAVFNLIVSNFQSLLAQIASNPIATLIIGLAQIILSTIAGFLGELPLSSQILSGTFRAGGQSVTYTAQKRTVARFKKDYNSVATAAGHPEIKLHVSLWESL
jgi:hypothetical protein